MRLDPYPTYARLRREAPVYRNLELDFWALSRHRDVAAALRDANRFSSVNGPLLDRSMWGPDAHKVLSFQSMDAPRHTAMRELVAPAFSPSGVAALRPEITRITRSHLDPALERGSFDFVADLAAKVPMDVISGLVGVPPSERDELRELMDQATHRPAHSRDVPAEGAAALTRVVEYLLALIAERRRAPKDDLTSGLISARVEGQPLTDREILACLVLLVVAGNETTARLLSSAWYWAWRYPDQRRQAFDGRIQAWAEETLRYDAPTQYILRTATDDVEVAGTVLPQGARVMLLIAAANRDPDVFADPDRFDLDRGSRALAFGLGRHFCLGAPLARLEAQIVLSELAARVDADYDIDAEGALPTYTTNVRGFARLPTTVSPR